MSKVIPMRPIPIHEARSIAAAYGYDQVIIIARRVGDDPEPHGEHVTTYGRDESHCAVAGRVGLYLKHKIMGWPDDQLIDRQSLLKKLRNERDAYVHEHFVTDPETGASESSAAKEEYVGYLDEAIEAIEMFPSVSAKPEGGAQ